MSVKVGVRVRPFNKRQQQLQCRLCIDMQGSVTHLISKDGQKKSFNYDYSFWSHDLYKTDPDGVFIPVEGDKYADQKRVYEEIGAQILVNAWQGYNCCLFAYGQTGSGKSYSMLGYGANRGIIPQVCDQIFTKIKKDTNQKHSYEVRVSMMEIYNETLRDLLVGKKKTELKICEHKKLGVYVQGLNKHPVRSYQQIEKKIQEGSNNRSIAATLMNESSSRSHTIVSINFVQKIQLSGTQTSVKYSTIHLVDLAGSQSVGKTGVDSKDRLREAAKINQSLSTLGRVIQILAENTTKADKTFVPYRDSKLTFILRNALGGNSRTAMICAISPADDNYQQTLSTLRYAQRAKKIQNKAIVNESDIDKLIRMLRQQNQMLKRQLKQAKMNKTVINQQIISNVNQMNKNMAAFGIMERQDSEGDDSLSFDDSEKDISLAETSFCFSQKNIVNQKDPFITNLSEDQMLSGRLKYNCNNGLVIGTKLGEPRPDIVLASLGIQPHHAKIICKQEKIYLTVLNQNSNQYTFLNGQTIGLSNQVQLMNMDRVIFGTGCVFLVKIFQGPIRQVRGIIPQPNQIDYAFAIAQLNNQGLQKNNKTALVQQQQIRKKVLEQIHEQYDKLKEQNEKALKTKLQQQQALYSSKLQQIEKKKQQQMQKMKQELLKQAQQAEKLRLQRQAVLKDVQHYKVIEKQLTQNNQNKQQLEKAQQALAQKMTKINLLEQSLLAIQNKQQQMKNQIEQRQILVKKQLQVKMVMCNNENILNDYKLELSKKNKNTHQLKQLLIRKQKIQLQKQLVQLVPKIQKFNLISKQMNKQIECGLSIDYKYFSQGEIIDVLKNSTYKNKLRIIIHVINRAQRRNYFWTVDVFNNRFQLALSMFQLFIRSPTDPQIHDREVDPFWDPPSPNLVGIAYISLQSLFYKLSFEGEICIVNKGVQIGQIKIHIFPTDSKGTEDLSKHTESGIVINNPRDMIEKSLSFKLQILQMKLNNQQTFETIQMQYSLPQKSYKRIKHKSLKQKPNQFNHFSYHTIHDLSQTTIFNLIDQPLALKLWGTPIIQDDDQLTVRNEDINYRQSFTSQKSESNASQINLMSEPIRKSKNPNKNQGIIVSNFDVMSKIQTDYSKKKKQQEFSKSKISPQQTTGRNKARPKLRNKDDCRIF